MKRLSDFVFGAVVLSVVPAAPAHAYLDPASISMALQVITGTIAGALLFGKTHLLKIVTFFRRKSPTGVPAAKDAER